MAPYCRHVLNERIPEQGEPMPIIRAPIGLACASVEWWLETIPFWPGKFSWGVFESNRRGSQDLRLG